MNHSTLTPENGSTQDIDFSALMTFEPEITQDQLETAFKVFNNHAISIRLALAVLTKTPQQLLESYHASPEMFTQLLEEISTAHDYMPSLSELVSGAFHRLMVVGGCVLKEGGAA